jgi:hypothetical protein
LQPDSDKAELARLVALLGKNGSLLDLNLALCDAIESRGITLETKGLADHLWATTLEKLAVDQPRYAAYERAQSGARSAEVDAGSAPDRATIKKSGA